MKEKLPAAAALAVLAFALVLGARALGLFVAPELAVYDQLLRWRSPAIAPSGQVVMLGATEEDLRRFGWPLSDERLAQVIEASLERQARAVGIDLYRDLPVPPGGERLAAALAAHEQVFGVTKLGDARTPTIAAAAALRGTRRVGFADVIIDPDGVVRRGLLYLEHGGANHEAFALLLALRQLQPLGVRPQTADAAGTLRLGKTVIAPLEPDDGAYAGADTAGYQFLLDFAGGAAPFRRYSVGELLDGRIPAGALRDKVVILGVTAESVKDFFYTPLHGGGSDEVVAYGIAVHAQVVDQLLRLAEGRTPLMRPLPEWLEVLWLAASCLLGAAAVLLLREPLRLLLTLAAGLAAIAAASYAAFEAWRWLPVAAQSAGWLLAAGLVTGFLAWRDHVQRGELMQLFSRHVSDDIAAEIWGRRQEFLAGDGMPRRQRLVASVLFSDIKGFTSVSERLEPQELMDWLNRYMAAMTGLVRRHHGTVDKLIGDAVMAVFGIPIARLSEGEIARDAVRAVECALAMRASLDGINRDNLARGLPEIEIRVGIHTGPLIAGSLGSRERLQYTVIGDTVNTASRLESFKTADGTPAPAGGGCRILIGGETLRRTGERYCVTLVGEVRLKGKDQAVTVYSVDGRRADAAPSTSSPETAP